jgi:hypothetical protein
VWLPSIDGRFREFGPKGFYPLDEGRVHNERTVQEIRRSFFMLCAASLRL